MKKLRFDKLYLSLLGVLAVFAVCVSYLITQTLDTPLLNRPDKVIVELPSTGGVYVGSGVTYRGMKIGKVTEIQLTKGGVVEATATITNPVKIPMSSPVKVRSLSPVGEQYLDFQPISEQGPYLKSGGRVTATSSDIPKTLASTVVNVNKLLQQLDKEDLHTALQGIGTALNGTGDDIGRLADQGHALLQTIDQNWGTTERLLGNGQTLLQLGADNAGRITTIASSSKELAAFLKDFDPELRKLLASAPGQFKDLQMVLATVDEVLPKFLDRTIKITDIVIARDAAFRELLRSYSLGITTLGSGFYNGAIRGHIELADRWRCDYGGPKRKPTEIAGEMWTGGHCKSAPADRLVRGAENRPRG